LMSSFLLLPPPSAAPYTLSLHDALPIWRPGDRSARLRALAGPPRRRTRGPQARALAPHRRIRVHAVGSIVAGRTAFSRGTRAFPDRKSTRLNSSHVKISYAVFCLKKKKK